MITKNLGYLRIGDEFYFKGQKHKATSLGNKDMNNVCCMNLETKKRIWLDVTTDVDVKEKCDDCTHNGIALDEMTYCHDCLKGIENHYEKGGR